MPETHSPSPTPSEQTCWLPRHHKSPRAARRELREFLLPHPAGEPLLPVGELLVSELVTNAVQHARAPRGRLIFVRFLLSLDDTLRIEVHDADSEKPSLRPATSADESGRGLLLIQELATQWGCCPRVGGIGKFVWCHLSPDAAAA
ncbi:Histidine kinase-like ATPase domain-containing protein [Streptomyces sp. TLI_053]|uniref:ATP-binding protein n=1 Tax=Streptomyces sp. TLI_053 TaxID=1855352 RepID=UPI00087CBA09|nr:ATP-binding protein [Streptomyces sp. TLI_053]SDT62574.1 Histidine kinase-like ATPase domain-containing protein [Streptomyces sp. TLI_053]